MGLTGSPPTSQCPVEIILVWLNWKISVPYLDDSIVISSSLEEQFEWLRLVFEGFRVHISKINPDNCDFFLMKVHFLGPIVRKNGVEVDSSKVEAIQKFPVPKSQTEVKSFSGLASYYRRFVPKFAEKARPLHKASETSTKFEGTLADQDAFGSFIFKLTSTPILPFPCLKEPSILQTDASQFTMVAGLAIVQDGKKRIICCASKSFCQTQTQYSATHRVLLALKSFTRHFRHYLLGQNFTMITDHSAFQWLHSSEDPDGRTARWLEKLAVFDYEVHHWPSNSIIQADWLSCIPPTPSMQLKVNFILPRLRMEHQKWQQQ